MRLLKIDHIPTRLEKLDMVEPKAVKETTALIKFAAMEVATLEEEHRGEGSMMSLCIKALLCC